MKLRIAITADPFIPIPPLNYGGIERMIDFLVEGLIARGHEVILVANGDSTVETSLIGYPSTGNGAIGHIKNMLAVKSLVNWKPDIIHSFSRLAYLLPLMSSNTPKLMSYQREPTLPQIKKALLLSKKGTLTFTGCSNYITNQIKTVGSARTIYNGVDLSKYDYQNSVDNNAPLMFLGRLEPVKGPHHAIATAIKTGRRLIIAGNIAEEHMEYYNTLIRPYLSNNIEHVGPVNDAQKNKLLGSSLALLMPVDWNEPFGIVMCEAMACGTPVIAFNKGAIPEVVKPNLSGIVCNNMDEMVNAVSYVYKINRQTVRNYCAENFSSEVIVDNYLKLYFALIKNKQGSPTS